MVNKKIKRGTLVKLKMIMDISLIKVDKFLNLNNLQPASFRKFSVTIIPATVSAFGFDLREPSDNFSRIDWFMILKLINASENSLIIENIEAECIGKYNYRCKSDNFSTQIYKTSGESEEDVISKLLKDDTSTKQLVFLPLLLKAQSEKLVRVNFTLEVYRRVFLKLKPTSFRRQEIKEPETYQDLLQKAIIKIKINESSKPLLLKI